LLHIQDDQDVSALTTPGADIPLAAQRDVVVRGHAGGYLDFELALRPLPAVTVAPVAGIRDAAAFPVAGRTDLRTDELAEHAPLHASDLSRTVAGLAESGAFRRLRTRPAAFVARLEDGESHLLQHPCCD